MNNQSDLPLVKIEASESLKSALEKLVSGLGANSLTHDERFEIVALNLQILLELWRKHRRHG